MTAMQQALLNANIVTPQSVAEAEERQAEDQKREAAYQQRVVAFEYALETVMTHLPTRVFSEVMAVVESHPDLITQELLDTWVLSISKQQRLPEKRTRALALWSAFLFQNQLLCVPA